LLNSHCKISEQFFINCIAIYEAFSKYLITIEDLKTILFSEDTCFNIKKIIKEPNSLIKNILDNNFDEEQFFGLLKNKFHEMNDLLSWYPEIIDKVSHGFLHKLIDSFFFAYQDYISDKLFDAILKYKPNFLLEDIKPRRIQEKHIPIIEEMKSKKPDLITEEPKQEEEPTIASLNIIVKIARTLDTKKKYILADKLTKIIGKYNVQQ